MSILSRISDVFARWYNGKHIPPEPNDPNDSIIIISAGYYERHWSAKIASALGSFYLRHWQWFWSTIIGVLGLYVAVLALK